MFGIVDSVATIDTLATTYNFEVAHTHTYFVGTEGVLVHNSCTLIGREIVEEGNYIGGFFSFDNGHIIEFLCDKLVTGNRLEMKNIIFYPRNIPGNELANAFGTRVMLQTLDELKQYAKNRGFTELRVQYQRASNSSAAVPGSILDKIFKL